MDGWVGGLVDGWMGGWVGWWLWIDRQTNRKQRLTDKQTDR